MISKKNIAIIQFYFYPDISAISQMLCDLIVEAAKDKRYKFTVFSGRTSYQNDKSIEEKNVRLPGIKIRRFVTFNFGKKHHLTRLIDYLFYYISVFLYFLFSTKWDIVICFSSPPLISFFVALALLFKKSEFIHYVQDLFPEILFDLKYFNKTSLIGKLMYLKNIVFKKASKIISIGSYMSKKIEKYNFEYKEKIVEINNWAKGIDYVIKKSILPDNKFTIMYSGNMGLAHDFSLLERLLYRLKSINNLEYKFTGDGLQKSNLVEMFKAAGEKRVLFNGYYRREDLGCNLASADLFIISQKKETVGDILPSKIYSYLAAGRPILYFGIKESEIGEIILQNDIGIICETKDDIEDVFCYIESLKINPKNKETIGKRARKLFIDKYQLKYSVKKFTNALNDI